MQVGVVGLGRIGRFHARVLAETDGVDGVAVSSRSAERAADVAAEIGGRTAPDYDSLLSEVDAVVIASATDTHAGLIERAAAAGVAVFCEKPIALDLETTDAAIGRVGEAGVPLQVGFQRRFDAGYRRAREAAQAGELGTVYAARTASHDPSPPPESFLAASGGIYRDFMVHDIDAVRFVLEREIVEVRADASVPDAMPDAESFRSAGDAACATALLRCDDGTVVVATASRHDPRGYDVRMELFGSEDSVMVGWDERLALRSLEPGAPAPGAGWPEFLVRFEPAYRAELAAFLDVARGRRDNPCPPADARAALRVAIACDRSLAERRPVAVEEVG